MPMLTLYYKERDIMVRERSSATYRVTSFYVSKLTTFIPISLTANTIFFTGVYFISRLSIDADKFFIGLATFYSLITVSITFMLLVGSAIKSIEFGFVAAPIVLTIQILFGGLFANPKTITPVLRWIRWVNPVQYAFSSFAQNELRSMEFVCQAGVQCYENGTQVIESYGLGRFTIWQNILLLLMLATADIILGYSLLRWTAKPRGILTPTPLDMAFIPQAETVLQWEKLTYEVATMVNKSAAYRVILNEINGEVRAGETIAIIGSSGAGKTTLLNALSGRIIGGSLTGRVLYHGAQRHPSSFRRLTAYVQQGDIMHPLLTVEETLDYASKLRLPNSLHTAKDKRDRVAKIIKQLRLESVRKSQIGDMKVRGVSGGERKRVSIGTELLTNPSLIFLDEPMSGLDSNSSQLVVELVKQIVNERRIAALMTIHQPSARIFNLFDKVILLS
ncbi:hypothetical protein LPJ66_007720 [Kickxella alabastrina]|uniref:Uncharacterized protein n=1 Tax=Kickxella alabastrina TaxID=61397 RepID=A0ACC1IE87_9FUNG|nr:hypothetical protein LPJ66_007720 [Kickxella alabastrina]